MLITIVDDDKSVREAVKGLVRSLGYRAITFRSAEEFLVSDVSETLCLITDVQMPCMSGFDLHRHLVAQGVYMPTIFMTAFPEEGMRARAVKTGVFGYLGKPFSEESLINCVDSALQSYEENVRPQPQQIHFCHILS
jgi:FixJ family two-component response regulator